MSKGAIPVWTLGDKLRKARVEAGLSAQDMAGFLTVSRYTISNYEHDTTEPTLLQVWLWARYCGVDPRWLDERVTDEYLAQMERVLVGPSNIQWYHPDGDFDPEPAAMAA